MINPPNPSPANSPELSSLEARIRQLPRRGPSPQLDARMESLFASATSTAAPHTTAHPLPHRNRLPLAIAAALLLCISIALFLLNRPTSFSAPYPAPSFTGPLQLLNSTTLATGSEIQTTSQPATLSLGNYCSVTLAPHTRLTLQGSPRAEALHLSQGSISCAVNRNVGTFDVTTDLGTVSVHGTSFTVSLRQSPEPLTFHSQGDPAMNPRQLLVAVVTGTVAVTSPFGNALLTTGQQQTFAAAPAATTSTAPASQPADDDTPPPAPYKIVFTQSVYFDPVIEALETLNFDGNLNLSVAQKKEIQKTRDAWKKAHDEFNFSPKREAIRNEYRAAQARNDSEGCLKALKKERDYYLTQPDVDLYIDLIKESLTLEQRNALSEELQKRAKFPDPRVGSYEQMLRLYDLLPK